MNRKPNQLSHRRPIYRDSKEEKAVKVYTINQESRYILVKGVPKISNITEEVLKPFSLYGRIQEYRILDDYPDIEEFTTVYWIKYVEIQSARVAKRKMNNRSFFGGFLKVIYAPEYEDVEDTRQKLIGRRKGVARRLRQLEKTERDEQDVHLSGETPSRADERDQSEPEVACSSSSSSRVPTVDRRTRPSADGGATSHSTFPALPLPPVVLPYTEWIVPSSEQDPSIPRVPSAHATLPKEFNPHLDNDNPRASQLSDPHKFPSPGKTSATRDGRNNTRSNFRGRGDIIGSSSDYARTDRPVQTILPRSRTSHYRPNRSADHGEGAPSIFQLTKPPDRDLPSSSPWVVTGRGGLDGNQQPPGGIGCPVPRGGARPKVVPRKRFAWTGERTTNPVPGSTGGQQFLGQRQNPAPLPARNPSGEPPQQPQYVPRQVQSGLKRRAEPDGQAISESSDAASSSFDQSVLDIRQRMRQVNNPATTTQDQDLPQPQGVGPLSHLSASSGQNPSGGRAQPSDHGPPGKRTGPSSSVNERRADPTKRRRI